MLGTISHWDGHIGTQTYAFIYTSTILYVVAKRTSSIERDQGTVGYPSKTRTYWWDHIWRLCIYGTIVVNSWDIWMYERFSLKRLTVSPIGGYGDYHPRRGTNDGLESGYFATSLFRYIPAIKSLLTTECWMTQYTFPCSWKPVTTPAVLLLVKQSSYY